MTALPLRIEVPHALPPLPPINLRALYLTRVWLEAERMPDPPRYQFSLPLLRDGFELTFDRAITIILGENGLGK